MPHSGKRNTKVPSRFNDYETQFKPKNHSPIKKGSTKLASAKKRRIISVIDEHTFFSSSKVQRGKSKAPYDLKKIIQTLNIDNMIEEDYIPSDLDQSGLVSVKSVNLLKKHGGRGLFANREMSSGTCIGIYTGEIYTTIKEFEEYLKTNPEADNSYAMAIGGRMIDAAKKGNFTRYINFSDSQDNVEFVEGKLNGHKVVKVITTKNISEGQQFLVNYNTYEERASKLYYFLNPGDGSQSASELCDEYAEQYQLVRMPFATELFRLKKNNNVYVTSIGKAILEDKLLSEVEEMPFLASINLPFLKANTSKSILDFDEADAFTPLMMACYLGQLGNTKWLIKFNANINQQQNHSGNCPLFFALEGYAATAASKIPYVKIIQLLISEGANIFTHDRADRIFLHKAISILSAKDFKTVMTVIRKQEDIVFNDLFTYIDENDSDILMHCLKMKSFDKAKILLDMFPEYFIENCRNKQQKLFCKKEFNNAISDYNEEDKETLLKLLGNKKYKVSSEFLDELAPNSEVENAPCSFRQ